MWNEKKKKCRLDWKKYKRNIKRVDENELKFKTFILKLNTHLKGEAERDGQGVRIVLGMRNFFMVNRKKNLWLKELNLKVRKNEVRLLEK